jgi:hypothetical protein
MRPNLIIIARFAMFLCFSLAACASQPKVSLQPGYYAEESRGAYRRLIVYEDSRRLSYDIWRVSMTPSNTALHQHFDLVGGSPSPQSGWYQITQDGSDCGKAWLEPYRDHGTVVNEIIVFEYMGARIPFGSSGAAADPATYQSYDRDKAFRIAQLADFNPGLYAQLSKREQSAYSELQPACNYL